MNETNSNLYQEFLLAVNSLFHSNNKEEKRKANKFICEFDKRHESWDVSYQIISSNNLSDEVYFNAIQILKNKIKFDFGNYSENREMIIELISFLIEKIDKFKNLKHYILLNYCYCFSMAMLFSGSDFNKLLKKCVEKLSNNNINDTFALLFIFNYLVEVYYDKTIVIEQDKRKEFNLNLETISNDVIQFLNNLISNIKQGKISDEAILKVLNNDILETFSNWLKIKLDKETIQKLSNEYIDIINFVFEINENNIQKHTDCINNLLDVIFENEEMENLSEIIFSKIISFKEIFYKNINCLDQEQCSFYVRIFSSLIQNNLGDILLKNRLDLIQLMVDLTKICPSSQIYLICDFFIYLDEFLYGKQVSKQNILSQFKGTYIQLIKNMINLMIFPNEVFSLLNINKTKSLKNNDEYNDIKDYRYSISFFLKDFTRDYSFNFVYDEIIFPEFYQTVELIKQNQNNINYWSKFEGILYSFSCIAELINENEINLLNVIFNTIFDVPKTLSQITRTVTNIIDEIKDIIGKNESLLSIIFKYLIERLDNELTLKYCSITIQNLLSSNKNILYKNKDYLIDLYENNIKDKVLNNNKYLSVLGGLVEVICYSKGNEDLEKNIISIFKQWVLYLIEVKDKCLIPNVELSQNDINKLIELLIILKYVSRASFEGLSNNNYSIMEKIFNEIWPQLKIIWNKFSNNNDLVEEIIQLIKYYMRGLNKYFINFIPEYLNNLIEGYKLSPISSYLYGFEVLITVFGNEKEDNIKNMINLNFNKLCQITFDNYIRNSNDLLINVQVGEDFFGLIFRILKINPFFCIDSEMFNKIIQISIENLSIVQIQTSKYIILLINNLIDCPYKNIFQEWKEKNQDIYSFYYNKIQKKIEEFISPLIKEILNAFLLVPPNVIYENLKDLIFTLISRQNNLTVKYFTEHLINFPADVLTNREKEKFIKLIQNYSSETMQLEDYLEILLKRCRNKQIRDKGQLN